MFSDLSQIRAALEALLKPQLPDTWDWTPYADTIEKVATPTVGIEFTGIVSAPDGEPLGPGQAGAEFNLVITDVPTDTKKAEDAVDKHVLAVIFTLDKSNDLHWSTAAKRRLQSGQMAWIISCIALAQTPDPTEGD